jgi:hypothetical protein
MHALSKANAKVLQVHRKNQEGIKKNEKLDEFGCLPMPGFRSVIT